MNRSRCFHTVLAKNGLAKIDYCAACGVVTLHIGAISMRFDPESVESLWVLFSEAVATLRSQITKEKSATTDKLAS